MTKLRSKGLTGAVLVAVLMAGSLRGLEAGADNAAAWETRSAVAESSVIEGQGWWKFAACIGCVAGAVVGSVVSAGTGAAAAAIGCGILCGMAAADDF